MKTKDEIIEELIGQLESTKYCDLEYLGNNAYEAGRKSILPLLRKAFDAGQDNCYADEPGVGVLHELEPDEAFNQFLKENNIEI
jgi:hypothetical protein